MSKLIFSEKSWDLFKYPSRIDIAEGAARTSKSTSIMFKFGLHVDQSDYTQFFIAAQSSVVARRNLVDNPNGFMDMFDGYVTDGKNPKIGNYLRFIDSKGIEKFIYVFGYSDSARWKQVLGGTSGGGVIDEINTANQDFINEVFRSFASIDNWWLGATLNPDNPDLEIYNNLINKARPLKKWVKDIPPSIIEELKKVKPMPGAVYWHFNFSDNYLMTDDKIDAFKSLYPPDSFFYRSKIMGERGVSEGVIFGKYLNDSFFSEDIEVVYEGKKQVMNEIDYYLLSNQYIYYSFGLDLGNNELKNGTILTWSGITRGYKERHVIDVYECTSTETNALVNEICLKIVEWTNMIVDLGKVTGLFVDGYGAIAIMIPTIRKRLKSLNINIKTNLAIKFGDDGGRMSRMLLYLMLINQKRVKYNRTPGCKKLFKNLCKIVYADDGLPLDQNKIENDYYDSDCYSMTPYTKYLNKITVV